MIRATFHQLAEVIVFEKSLPSNMSCTMTSHPSNMSCTMPSHEHVTMLTRSLWPKCNTCTHHHACTCYHAKLGLWPKCNTCMHQHVKYTSTRILTENSDCNISHISKSWWKYMHSISHIIPFNIISHISNVMKYIHPISHITL